MSVPFSNTHLRVPRGFGTILEGLAREVLRDQPQNIPEYAARYFAVLLEQREESGMDPAEWAAKLEDRFYNNHAFKAAGVQNQPTANPEKKPAMEATISKEKAYESQTEDESSHSAEAGNLSTIQPNVSKEVDLTERTEDEEEEEEKHDITEKHIFSIEKGPSDGESINRLSAADAQSDEAEQETINTLDKVDRATNEKDSSSAPDQDAPQSELESTDLLSFSGVYNVDVCAQELGVAEDEEGDKLEAAAVDKESIDSEEEENTEVEEPAEVPPYSGLADVDVCAAELGGTEGTMKKATAEDEEEEHLKTQPEESLEQSYLSQFETPEGNEQEVEDEAERTEEDGTEIEASSGEVHEHLAHINSGSDSNVIPKQDSLVEISFEDVPAAQQITELGEKQTEEEGLVELSQGNVLELQQEEESKKVTAESVDQNISGTQHYDEPEMEADEKVEEIETQREASDTVEEKVDTNDSNLNDSDDDDEKEEGVYDISSSHQDTTASGNKMPEDETNHTFGDNKKIPWSDNFENESRSTEHDFEEEEATDKEDIQTEGYSQIEDENVKEGGMENYSSEVTQSNASVAAVEAEDETSEADAQNLPEESERTLVETQPEDAVEGKEVTSKEAEELLEEVKIDSEVQERGDATSAEESISRIHSAEGTAADHQGEEKALVSEKDTTKPEGESYDKEECSRPQEEEDIMDIPLDDPEANRAAAKIQAGFRGHMTRKKMKPEDKAEGEEVSSTGDVLNGSQGDTETGGSGAVESDDTSVPEQ